jgi:hypothetical protein
MLQESHRRAAVGDEMYCGRWDFLSKARGHCEARDALSSSSEASEVSASFVDLKASQTDSNAEL